MVFTLDFIGLVAKRPKLSANMVGISYAIGRRDSELKSTTVMKTEIAGANLCRLSLFIILFITIAVRSSGMVFTEDTEIGPLDTNYDGQDLVILDCTVTVDGPHTFSSLVLAANGVLTHSFSQNGQLPIAINVTNASYLLSGTTPDVLAYSNIFSPLLVTDTNGNAYTNEVDYVEINQTNGTYISTDLERTTNSSIPDGGTVLVSYSYDGTVPSGLDLTVTGVVWVTSGCEIDADGIGYGAGFGPGAGSQSSGTFFDGSGGGDGGSGGMSLSNAVGGVCYDSLFQPAFIGSGGGASYAGSGGNGGGLVRITASDEVEIDGVISANGVNATNSRSGGGSGGGIYISAPAFSGAGSLSANGGLGAPGDVGGGGGGGGRVAIVCGTNNFVGSITAYGGGGANFGGAGTVYTDVTGQPGLLTLNNNGNVGANSTVSLPNSIDVEISGGAGVVVSGTFLPHNLVIGTNDLLTGMAQTSLAFSAANLTLMSGGAISVNGLNTITGQGGVGTAYTYDDVTYGGGGGHGGTGGAAAVTIAVGGTADDSTTFPVDFGGLGAGDSAGGGAMNINVSGTLQVNGSISANGVNGNGTAGGGGAGGSIYLKAGTFSGNGMIAANGGSGANSLGGGGGGGRVAMIATSYSYAGGVQCFGGDGANYGGAGTIYLAPSNELILDNGGNAGASTPLAPVNGVNVVIQHGAWAPLSGSTSFSFENLTVASNSWLAVSPATSYTILSILGSATFQAGGGFTLNSDGFPANTGDTGSAGFMTVSPYGAGGGGNGGMGGASIGKSAAGGLSGYNSVTSPEISGGGGGGDFPYSIGGNGGGAVIMNVAGTLLNNGAITANGGNGSGIGGGGGAGGSLDLSVATLSGSGSITANGGNGVDGFGGGGGGGCIAITFNSNLFGGALSAFGGTGAYDGGAGTIYLKTNSATAGQIIVDNGGESGAGSTIGGYLPSGANLTLRNDGNLYENSGTFTFANLVISNASLIVSNYPLTITANNISLQNGGAIIANAAGYPAAEGPDPGRPAVTEIYPFAGSGGGNGGCGGMAYSNEVAGGGAYTQPYTEAIEAGSGGGSSYINSLDSTGGKGGGVIDLNVYGTLAVNGTISANGGNGLGIGGGGGAGGSLALNVGSLTGSGVISANGGSGVGNVGGGGGGGFVVVNLQQGVFSNLFTGTISAYGGGGWTNGGAGPVFIKTNETGFATLILDNGGNLGTNTPINYSSSEYSLVIRNGAIATFSGFEDFSSLLIASNGWLVPLPNVQASSGEIELSLTGSATIQAGGGIIADSGGYSQNGGTGHGNSDVISPWYPCSGAGHSGYGAMGLSNVLGGITYDNIQEPQQQGSGGGGYGTFSTGGTGGGFVELELTSGGALQVNGMISANGGNGSGIGGGGGSGGSIYLSAGTIYGSGSITANGGSGALNIGGGGGGGYISLDSTAQSKTGSNTFLGTISAYGGGGANYGGAGTLYYRTNNSAPGLSLGMLYLDNDNNVGTDTTISVQQPGIIIIQNGAIGVTPSTFLEAQGLQVLSNGILTSLTGQATIEVPSMTVAAGGVVSMDGRGYALGTGTGGGQASGTVAGGGGHGGYGGGDLSGGGTAYDSIVDPTAEGSGGANSSDKTQPGGAGGGVLTLDVTGNLIVNGRVSANGVSGGINAGGGAGGSILVSKGIGLSGSGIISANGGAGSDSSGGGGGGGRIAVTTVNNFTGQYSASGGGGAYPGGAGTIYISGPTTPTLTVNNGGISGTNTPLSSTFSLPSAPFNLVISGGASVVPITELPQLGSLSLSAGSTLTTPVAQPSLSIGVSGNATIAGNLNVDDLGYSQGTGPGAGATADFEGSGGGYGGAGGASESGAHGGATYGSAIAPSALGSGGGSGADTTTGGSSGGGALRLSVDGTLTVNGNVSANGDSGLQDDSGGGSGGSVWITAETLSGAGTISAAGGDGVLYGGGGGGGGRIAIFAPINQFTGTTNATGGIGAADGQSGTVSVTNSFDGLQILSQSPTGLVMNTVSSVNLTFSDMLNAGSVSASDFTVITPAGPLPQSSLSVQVTSAYTAQVNFPTQNLVGTYTVQVGTAISDTFGQMLEPYIGTFTVSLPTISGTVTGTNGAGVAGVSLAPGGGLIAAVTDTNGNYSLGVPPGWTGTVTPSFGTDAFVPSSMSYTNVTVSVAGQNYSMLPTISPTLTTKLSSIDASLNWQGISGVTYQVLWSTNLVTWQPYGSPIPGTNGPMQIVLPSGSNSAAFFQLQAGD